MAGEGLRLVRSDPILYGHVFELAGFKDFTAFEALYVLGLLVAAHNLHARVLTLSHCPSLLGELRQRLASYIRRRVAPELEADLISPEIWGIVALPL